ncbi:aldose epimerase family protein [Jeotgalibacillus marinus]|uniref:Aldose 1-epimerase n=1 Tax=Jeotgalibacillus marinus TaxID=86667 RepID=A0ABV3Q372_9BACL
MDVTKEVFGYIDDQPVTLYTIKNDNGLQVECINYGGIITKILTTDRDGNLENIVLGYDTIQEYEKNSPYFGAVVGRVAGRIKEGKFSLEGNTYQVTQNENQHHLHGGYKGFSQVLWDTNVIEKENEVTIEFSYFSPDGEDGYPGNLQMNVKYTVNHDNELIISYYGFCDQTSLLNVTNHTYFNLSGNLKRDVLDHELTINSDKFIELNEELLPTGKIADARNTVFDFRKGRKIREGVHSTHPQNILVKKGYDHPFLLNANHQNEIILADQDSGRTLIVETDEPSVVLYTGNKLEGELSIRGTKARNYLGLCLETQAPPDSIHQPHFQSAIIKKGKSYETKTKYLFTVE